MYSAEVSCSSDRFHRNCSIKHYHYETRFTSVLSIFYLNGVSAFGNKETKPTAFKLSHTKLLSGHSRYLPKVNLK